MLYVHVCIQQQIGNLSKKREGLRNERKKLINTILILAQKKTKKALAKNNVVLNLPGYIFKKENENNEENPKQSRRILQKNK